MAIPQQQLAYLKEQLSQASRPLIFFDDDADGLSSYLLAKKCAPDAIGVRVAGGPQLTTDFLRRVEENMPDLILVLDKPIVEREWFEQCKTPTIWVDHHPLNHQQANEWNYPHLTYMNPLEHDPDNNEPVAYWMYRALGGKMWVGAIGTTADWHPSLFDEFRKQYPDLIPKENNVQEVLYDSQLGEMVRMFNFLLKGKTSQVRKNISALAKIEDPHELLAGESARSKYLHRQYKPVLDEYRDQLHEARTQAVTNGVFVHTYGMLKMSLIAEVANELLVRETAQIILVGRRVNGNVVFSMRSLHVDLRIVVEYALDGVDGYGGGHKEACGGSIKEESWETFVRRVEDCVE